MKPAITNLIATVSFIAVFAALVILIAYYPQ